MAGFVSWPFRCFLFLETVGAAFGEYWLVYFMRDISIGVAFAVTLIYNAFLKKLGE